MIALQIPQTHDACCLEPVDSSNKDVSFCLCASAWHDDCCPRHSCSTLVFSKCSCHCRLCCHCYIAKTAFLHICRDLGLLRLSLVHATAFRSNIDMGLEIHVTRNNRNYQQTSLTSNVHLWRSLCALSERELVVVIAQGVPTMFSHTVFAESQQPAHPEAPQPQTPKATKGSQTLPPASWS